MSLLNWAKNEIEIAKRREMELSDDGTYGCMCYDSALKAFKSLCKDNHSGVSIRITKNILDRLIDAKPLTPIFDTDDIWSKCEFTNDGLAAVYQCTRMTSLFKHVHEDGSISYSDNDRVVATDHIYKISYHSGLVSRYVDELYPIKMPYVPPEKPYRVYCEDYLQGSPNEQTGTYDHFAMLYMILPDGIVKDVGKYYKEVDKKMIEISREEYYRDKT